MSARGLFDAGDLSQKMASGRSHAARTVPPQLARAAFQANCVDCPGRGDEVMNEVAMAINVRMVRNSLAKSDSHSASVLK